MTPLIKSIIKYVVLILVTAILTSFIWKSCNKQDTSYYDRVNADAKIKIEALQKDNKLADDSIKVLQVQNDNLKKDSDKLVETTKQLIREKKTNQVLRALLANQNPDSSYWYSNDTLTQAENDSLAVRLADCALMPEIIQNQVKQLELFDFKIRGLENIIELKDLTIESLENKIVAIDKPFWDSFEIGVVATLLAEGLIIIAIILLQ
jgi:hypothetical protein